jgi:hypothetical protein
MRGCPQGLEAPRISKSILTALQWLKICKSSSTLD